MKQYSVAQFGCIPYQLAELPVRGLFGLGLPALNFLGRWSVALDLLLRVLGQILDVLLHLLGLVLVLGAERLVLNHLLHNILLRHWSAERSAREGQAGVRTAEFERVDDS